MSRAAKLFQRMDAGKKTKRKKKVNKERKEDLYQPYRLSEVFTVRFICWRPLGKSLESPMISSNVFQNIIARSYRSSIISLQKTTIHYCDSKNGITCIDIPMVKTSPLNAAVNCLQPSQKKLKRRFSPCKGKGELKKNIGPMISPLFPVILKS